MFLLFVSLRLQFSIIIMISEIIKIYSIRMAGMKPKAYVFKNIYITKNDTTETSVYVPPGSCKWI